MLKLLKIENIQKICVYLYLSAVNVASLFNFAPLRLCVFALKSCLKLSSQLKIAKLIW